LPKVKEVLALIQTKAPVAVARVIECVNNFDHTQQGYDLEVKLFAECFQTEDMKEGTSAFLEKRRISRASDLPNDTTWMVEFVVLLHLPAV
jgi:enoyl-CoA hydratase